MSSPTDTSQGVSQVVFGMTALAYIWLMAGYLRSGLILFSLSMIIAFRMGLFRRIPEWPVISKITLACAAPLIGFGCYFSTQRTEYIAWIPGLIYCALSIPGGLALRRVR